MQGRIVAVYQYLCYHRDALARDATPQKFIMQGLLDHITNRALCIRAA